MRKGLTRKIKLYRTAVQKLELQKIVDMLNDGFNSEYRHKTEARQRLIKLVQAWQDATIAPETHFEQTLARESLASDGAKPRLPALLRMKLPASFPRWPEIEKRCQAFLIPSGTGVQVHVQYVGKGGESWTALNFAVQAFIQLVTNPERDRLGGPCRRCGKYYIKKRASQKVYCSGTCGSAATAVRRTRQKWDQERGKRLAEARKAQLEWAGRKPTERFQDWAAARYPSLTKTFLTRAIGKGELSGP